MRTTAKNKKVSAPTKAEIEKARKYSRESARTSFAIEGIYFDKETFDKVTAKYSL